MHAIKSGVSEDKWPMVDESFKFEFSLWKNSILKIKKKSKNEVIGHYITLDRCTGTLKLADLSNYSNQDRHSPNKDVKVLEKYTIDRLGRLYKVRGESRTWTGKV
jgi:CRISPR-associated endonuclease Csn1